MKLGVVLFNIGWTTGVGGACLDDTLPFVEDCRDVVGAVMHCPSAFVFGVWFIVMAVTGRGPVKGVDKRPPTSATTRVSCRCAGAGAKSTLLDKDVGQSDDEHRRPDLLEVLLQVVIQLCLDYTWSKVLHNIRLPFGYGFGLIGLLLNFLGTLFERHLGSASNRCRARLANE